MCARVCLCMCVCMYACVRDFADLIACFYEVMYWFINYLPYKFVKLQLSRSTIL